MGRYWRVNCPYCGAEVTHGSGYGDRVPDFWIPFMRCEICGQLMKTGANEYITMPVEQRTQFRNHSNNCGYIAQSLDRTNNKDYIAFLQKNGFNIYPITNADRERFPNVPFERYINMLPSHTATQSLYDVGILIEESHLDKETGGIKQEILNRNQKEYNISNKILKTGAIVGVVIGVIFTALFGSLNPDSYLFLIGIAMGIGSAIAVILFMEYYYKNRDGNIGKSCDHKKKHNETDYKVLIEKCGIRFFIKYYKQIKRLPLRDVIISENYSFAEREERLCAVKSIIDLNLTELVLNEILKSYSDMLDVREVEQVRALLCELQSNTTKDTVSTTSISQEATSPIKPLYDDTWDD